MSQRVRSMEYSVGKKSTNIRLVDFLQKSKQEREARVCLPEVEPSLGTMYGVLYTHLSMLYMYH